MGGAPRETRQARSIRSVFERTKRPLRPDEALEIARRETPGLGAATLYRRLARLVEEGWLTVVRLPDVGPLYERADKGHHHHFHCRACDRVYELESCPLPPSATPMAPVGFKAEGHELTIYGLCEGCVEAPCGAASPTGAR